MSADTTPISPARFAAALKDLSEPMLRLKVLEVRNAIAHLQYSNDQLKPFAEGTATATATGAENNGAPSEGGGGGEPDQDCIDAIRENEEVIERMVERIALVRLEVEARGASWAHFEEQARADEDGTRTRAEADAAAEGRAEGAAVAGGDDDSHGGGGARSNPWTDGTFQTGTIRNGEVHMDEQPGGAVNGVTSTTSSTASGQQGGRLSDAQLRAAMGERMRQLTTEEEDDGGLHL